MRNDVLKVITNGLIILASIIFSLGLVEGGLRLGIVKTRIYKRLQAQGAVSAEKKMVIVGDSFIYKGGMLDQMLSSKLNPDKVQILNLATGGSGPQEYRSELKIFGMKYKPNIILLGYYAGNDLADVENKITFEGGLHTSLRPLWRSSYIFHLFNDAWMIWCQERVSDGNPYWWASIALKNPDFLNDNLLIASEETATVWNKTKAILENINALSKSVQAKLMIVIFPEAVQVTRAHKDLYERVGFRLDSQVFDSTKPQDLMMGFCREQQIDCLDLLPYFRQSVDELYLQDDPHLAEKGNVLAAELIADFVISRTA